MLAKYYKSDSVKSANNQTDVISEAGSTRY